MKRLFTIGSGLLVGSIIPVISWVVLSVVLGDDRITNVFSICYAFQFVWIILKCLFGSGANIRKEKEKDKNAVWNGIFWGAIFAVIIFAFPIIFIDGYINFFGQDVSFYKIYVIYGLLQLFEQTLLQLIMEKLYFEDKEKMANIHLFSFNILNFLVLIVLCLLISNTFLALMITLGIMFIYIIGLFIWQFEKFKIDFKFIKNIRYESNNLINALFMFAIYTFGYRNAFQAGEDYLLALNLVALCTDTQWDMLTARDTVAKVDIAKGRYDYKKEMRVKRRRRGVSVLFSLQLAAVHDAEHDEAAADGDEDGAALHGGDDQAEQADHQVQQHEVDETFHCLSSVPAGLMPTTVSARPATRKRTSSPAKAMP